MFKRVFKLILVGTLIFGITVPSNAAVSVSDGSAFVTKAEFSADLNNLSNRMAQLENSLDAKIDSLVSSYLTRNGIWNGQKQETSFNSTVYIAPAAFPGNRSQTTTLFSNTYITKINKSGLFNFYYSYRCADGYSGNSARFGYTFDLVSSGAWYSDNGFIVILQFNEVNGDNDNVVFSSTILSAIGTSRASGGGTKGVLYYSLPSSWVQSNCQFFVKKDSKINYSLFENVHFANTSSGEISCKDIEFDLDRNPQVY